MLALNLTRQNMGRIPRRRYTDGVYHVYKGRPIIMVINKLLIASYKEWHLYENGTFMKRPRGKHTRHRTFRGFAARERFAAGPCMAYQIKKFCSALNRYPISTIPPTQIPKNSVRSFGFNTLRSISMEGRLKVVTAIMNARTVPS